VARGGGGGVMVVCCCCWWWGGLGVVGVVVVMVVVMVVLAVVGECRGEPGTMRQGSSVTQSYAESALVPPPPSATDTIVVRQRPTHTSVPSREAATGAHTALPAPTTAPRATPSRSRRKKDAPSMRMESTTVGWRTSAANTRRSAVNDAERELRSACVRNARWMAAAALRRLRCTKACSCS
jgi:hypothetical protein